MNDEFKTSFIPKKRLTNEDSRVSQKSKHKTLFEIFAIVLFVTSVVSAVFVYIYERSIDSSLRNKMNSITRAEKAFEPNAILALKKLDIRLRAGDELLREHIALSDFFRSLNESTLPGVSFSNFDLQFPQKGIAEVSMDGFASSYLTIAQQSELFEKNKYILDPIFSDFERDEETGYINFSVNFHLNQDLIRYGKNLKNVVLDSQLDTEDRSHMLKNNNVSATGNTVDFSNFKQNS